MKSGKGIVEEDGGLRTVVRARFEQYSQQRGRLDLSNCRIDAMEMKNVASQLQSLRGVIHLDISSNPIGDEGIQILTEYETLAGLNSLDVSTTRTGDSGLESLARCKHLSGLETLNIANNRIGYVGTRALAESSFLLRLRRLLMRWNLIGKNGALELARSRLLRGLCELNLYNGQIEDEGVHHLARSSSISNLRHLYLGFNGIGEDGVKALATSEYLSYLHTLDLYGNRIGDEGVRLLSESDNFSGLRQVNIGLNGIGPDGAAALAGSKLIGQLQALTLSGNSIRSEGAKSLALAGQMTNMRTLELSSNEIFDARAVMALCRLMQRDPENPRYPVTRVRQRIDIRGNPLRKSGVGPLNILDAFDEGDADEEFSENLLRSSDPADLARRLGQVLDNGTQVFMARVVMVGPTEHGKTHLARWLTAETEEQKSRLKKRQDREHDGDGTWGAERLTTELRKGEHQQELPDVRLSVIDCGGHPKQLVSHQNLYFSTWSRSVFLMCVRADCDFTESWGEYYLGLIADLKKVSLTWRAHRKFNANLTNDDVQRRLPVVLVPTHADQANERGFRWDAATVEALRRSHQQLKIIGTDAWNAISGESIAIIKTAIGRQLVAVPELRAGLPEYVVNVGKEIEMFFGTGKVSENAPKVNSLPFSKFRALCKPLGVDRRDYLYTLQELDTLGYVVAPRCHDEIPGTRQTILNPRFVQHFLYVKLLRSASEGGIVEERAYRVLTNDLTEADRTALESMMASCLFAFRIRGYADQPLGWLIPDLLKPSDEWPMWTEEVWTVHLAVHAFLNESIFFEFVRSNKYLIQMVIKDGEARHFLYRNFCVLRHRTSDRCEALVRFDVRKKTIDIEVRGGNDDLARQWCSELNSHFDHVTGTLASVPRKRAGSAKRGRKPDGSPEQEQRLLDAWAEARASGGELERFLTNNDIDKMKWKRIQARARARKSDARKRRKSAE